MKLLSWNVNGVRAALRYGLLDYLARERADVVCLQETRAPVEALAPLMAAGYHVFLNPAERQGYAGVAILSRTAPRAVTYGISLPEHDQEGRVITAEFDDFFLVSVYVPNSKNDLARLPYRQRWDAAFLAYLRGLEQRKPVIFCGDLNVAHTELDLARPKQNVGTHGFTPEERAGFAAFVQAGFLDSFRVFEPGADFTRGGAWRPARGYATSAGGSTISCCRRVYGPGCGARSSTRKSRVRTTARSGSRSTGLLNLPPPTPPPRQVLDRGSGSIAMDNSSVCAAKY